MFKRYISNSIQRSPKSILLLGPRQVGKSTLIESLKPDLNINLANQSEYASFLASDTELEDRMALLNPKTICIDEIQRIPELLNTIQDIIDKSNGKKKFYLTGSSARKLRRGQANLLPGRVFSYRLGPLSCLELDFKMDTLKALEIGTLPEPYFSSDRKFAEKLLGSYTSTYLHEEILVETLIRDLHGFSNFLKIVAENSGLLLDFSKTANKAKVNRSATRRYFEILDDSLICDRLESYFNENDVELSKLLVKHSKFYLFDVGIKNGVLSNFKASSDRIGILFEHLFFNQLKNISYCLDREFEIFHFRTHLGQELDFLIRNKKNELFAIELKASEPDSADLAKVKRALDFLPKGTQISIACINCKAKKKGSITIKPWQGVMQDLIQWLDS